MTEPLSDPLDLLPELVGEVRTLNDQVAAQDLSSKRHRAALIVAFVGLTVDVVLSLVVWLLVDKYNHIQDCRNDRSAAFFNAEVAKVRGQVEGLVEIRNSAGDPVKGTEGFDKFLTASRHYLDSIATIRGSC